MRNSGQIPQLFSLMLFFFLITFSISNASTPDDPQLFQPLPGNWSGITSQGNFVFFEVMDSQTHLRSFELTYDLDCGKTETWMFFSPEDGFEIINNQFFLTSSGRSFTGTFTSDNRSNGTFNINYFDITIGDFCRANGTWFAMSALLADFQIYQPLIISQSS